MADELAKEGCENRNLNAPYLRPSNHIYVEKIKVQLRNSWNRHWQQEIGCRQTKIFFEEIDLSKSKYIYSLNRGDLSQMVRFLTGHNHMRRHNHVIDNSVDPTCRLCEDDKEDSEHIITECEALWQIRNEAFGHSFLDTPPAWTPSELLQFLRHPKVKNLETMDVDDVNFDGSSETENEQDAQPNDPSN